MQNLLKWQYPIYRKMAFSLVELMVVIAIIGVLSAIATPSYKIYLIKSNIASGVPILTAAIHAATQSYDLTGTFANPLTVYGKSMNIASYNPITSDASTLAQGIWYNTVPTSNSVHMCLYFSSVIRCARIYPATNKWSHWWRD